MSKKDTLRLRAILQLLTEQFDDPEMDYLTTETKLWYAIAPSDYPIFRRKILKPMPVNGLWWMEESQWVRYLWQGHKATVLKSGQDPDRVLATRTFKGGSWCYIRENPSQIDIEGISQVLMWDPVTKKRKGKIWEWLTVSVTKESYEKLDNFLGPVNDGCKHEEGNYDYLAE